MICVLINIGILAVLSLIMFLLIARNSGAFFFDPTVYLLYICFFTPFVFFIINIILNVYGIGNWRISLAFLIVPLFAYLYYAFKKLMNNRLYDSYYERIKLAIVEYLGILGIVMEERDIHLSLSHMKNNGRIHSNIVIRLNEMVYNRNDVELQFKRYLEKTFLNVETKISLQLKEKPKTNNRSSK